MARRPPSPTLPPQVGKGEQATPRPSALPLRMRVIRSLACHSQARNRTALGARLQTRLAFVVVYRTRRGRFDPNRDSVNAPVVRCESVRLQCLGAELRRGFAHSMPLKSLALRPIRRKFCQIAVHAGREYPPNPYQTRTIPPQTDG